MKYNLLRIDQYRKQNDYWEEAESFVESFNDIHEGMSKREELNTKDSVDSWNHKRYYTLCAND